MKIYGTFQTGEDYDSGSEISDEIIERDIAIIELFDELAYGTVGGEDPSEIINKYLDFVTKTRAIHGR